ncbi:PREDICTED: probable purine permease 6 [Camelina sativa]|uniref:Probable purine permease n=1 Tax=Camelina sativa TaxID=90675 RepID=A0ABM0U1R2_CAMSA|nr:PREDICTED: probable purine permease 6 [Camelina sativa]
MMEIESETQELCLHVNGEHARNFSTEQRSHSYSWRIKVFLYVFLLLAGETMATLLGRLYYEKGGKSTWLETLVQLVGFPLTFPCYNYINPEPSKTKSITKETTSFLTLSLVYIGIGLVVAGQSGLYSFGLLYLPVSTFSLISASQLAFNAVFSYLNSQKITPFILNSLVLLTLSSTLLVIQPEPESSSKSLAKYNYVIGYICAFGSSAGYSLTLSLIDYAFEKVLKKHTFKEILDMDTYPSIVATCVVVVGLFGSGGWKTLRTDMEEFKLGKVSYIAINIGSTISWQAFSIGCLGLILEVSSLFSNVISTVGLPIVPFLGVVFFHDEMSGIKLIALVLAIWGFVSYAYHDYVDDQKPEEANQEKEEEEMMKLSQPEEATQEKEEEELMKLSQPEEDAQEENSHIQA